MSAQESVRTDQIDSGAATRRTILPTVRTVAAWPMTMRLPEAAISNLSPRQTLAGSVQSDGHLLIGTAAYADLAAGRMHDDRLTAAARLPASQCRGLEANPDE